MSRNSFFRPAAAILLMLAAGCSDPLPATPTAADVQASPATPTVGKAVKKTDVHVPGPSMKME
jgi:hypothetical protein